MAHRSQLNILEDNLKTLVEVVDNFMRKQLTHVPETEINIACCIVYIRWKGMKERKTDAETYGRNWHYELEKEHTNKIRSYLKYIVRNGAHQSWKALPWNEAK